MAIQGTDQCLQPGSLVGAAFGALGHRRDEVLWYKADLETTVGFRTVLIFIF
jgi:hypothetical protein